MKAVKAKLQEKGADEDTIKDFEKGAQAFAKKIIGSFGDYEFFIGESMDPDGMYVYLNLFPMRPSTNYRRVVLLNYREDGITPYVTVWKHGLEEMKV